MPKLELGPIGLLPPSAAAMGIFQPEKGSGMELVEGEENQIRQVFTNISAICEEANCSINDIVKLNVSLQDLPIFSLVNEVMSELFTEPYPARAALQVARLPLDSLIEVEAIIVKNN